MSLFTKIRDTVTGSAGTLLTSLVPGGALVKTGIGAVIGTLGSKAASTAGAVLPGVGAVAGGALAGGALARFASRGAPAHRRRGRGFSARDLRQQKRLVKMLKEFNAVFPKHRAPAAPRSCS